MSQAQSAIQWRVRTRYIFMKITREGHLKLLDSSEDFAPMCCEFESPEAAHRAMEEYLKDRWSTLSRYGPYSLEYVIVPVLSACRKEDWMD